MELKKAKSQQQKLQRVNSILVAAETLFEQNSDGELPSAIQIANQAGVAKGTLYIYFRTKEAIFLAVLERHIQNWIADFERQLRLYDSVTVADICKYLIDYWQLTPVFSELCRISDALLEGRVEDKVYSAYQTKIVNDFKRMAPSLKVLNPEVESTQWLQMLQLSQKLISLAWQQSHPRTSLKTQQQVSFNSVAEQLLTPFWQELMEYQKMKPQQKTGWRKLLGN